MSFEYMWTCAHITTQWCCNLTPWHEVTQFNLQLIVFNFHLCFTARVLNVVVTWLLPMYKNKFLLITSTWASVQEAQWSKASEWMQWEKTEREMWYRDRETQAEREGQRRKMRYQQLIVPSSARKLYDKGSFSMFWSSKYTSVKHLIQYKCPASLFTVLNNTYLYAQLKRGVTRVSVCLSNSQTPSPPCRRNNDFKT